MAVVPRSGPMRAAASWALALLAMAVAWPAQGQRVVEYTQNEAGPDKLVMGYPVPRPVDSITPVDGFRAYDSLHARHQALSLEHDFIAGHHLGETIRGADVFAYTVSDPNATTTAGYREPAFLITGGVHAREWQSPEVVTGIMERLAERRRDGGLYEYLVDSTKLVVIPVLNVDGFRQTQRYPARAILGTDPGDPTESPRDGRMRRKNMRGADTNLSTFGDHLNGVDLNRNNPPYAPSGRASGNPDSLIYHGGGSHTEPETQALAAAIGLAPAGRLRFYTDFHSFSQAFLDPRTNNSRLVAIQSRLINLARANLASQGTQYGRRSSPTAFTGIGSTDEFFAHRHEVPAWTLEIEPRLNPGGAQYGGFGVTHDGFILPESEIARVRDELATAYALLFYAQAGPPSVSAVRVLDAADNVVWAGEWRKIGPNRRRFVTTEEGSLVAGGDYRLWIAFDKPMRFRNEQGEVANYPGANVEIAPHIVFDGLAQEIAVTADEGRWLDTPDAPDAPGYRRYRDDAYIAPFQVPASVEPEGEALTLNVGVEDLAGNALDADPATVADWSGGHWLEYESPSGVDGDVGGTDATLEIPVMKAPPVAVSFALDRARAVEGGRVVGRLTREPTTSAFSVEVTAERVTGDNDPVSMPLFETRVDFGAGGGAEKHFEFTVPDDLSVLQSPATDEVRVTASIPDSGAMVAAPATRVVEVEDNDAPRRRVVSLLEPYAFPFPPDVSPPPPGLALGARLADALRRAQSVEEPVTINLADEGVYTLNAPEGGGDTAFPTIAGDVTIAGRRTLIARHFGDLDAESDFRLFHVLPGGSLTLKGVRLERGRLEGNRAGGAVLNEGRLQGERLVFHDNSANRAGALVNAGQADLRLSSFVGNTSEAGGGAIFNPGELTLAGVTFSGNLTEGRGGAILNRGSLELRESTLTDNRGSPGDDLFNSGTATISGSVLASDAGCANNLAGEIRSGGYNLDAEGSCGLAEATDQPLADPVLGPLDERALHLPAAESPLVSGIPEAGPECLDRDARGVPRPFAAPSPVTAPPVVACEIGAAERGLSMHRGMWFNPERSGHGIDLQQAGNQLVVTWFTYDTDGSPVWYQASGPFSEPDWEADLFRFKLDPQADEATGELVGTVSLTFESATEATFGWDLTAIGQGAGSEPFEPLVFGEGNAKFDTTGHWAAADGSSWGLSVDVQGATNVATVYYYDAEGNPRWVQGAGAAGLDVDLEVDSFTGFCPGCDTEAFPLTMTPAGSLDLRFLTREFGGIETDFAYPGAEGGIWQRSAGLGALSHPVH